MTAEWVPGTNLQSILIKCAMIKVHDRPVFHHAAAHRAPFSPFQPQRQQVRLSHVHTLLPAKEKSLVFFVLFIEKKKFEL